MTKNLVRLTISFVIALFAFAPALAQELIPHGPDVTVLRERSIPLPFGVSPEMTGIVTERRHHTGLPVPTTIEAWLELQKGFDLAGDELGRQAAEHNGVTYEVQEIAGVRTYIVTPKKINERFADRVFVHAHGGAFVFGGGDSVLREAVWAAHGLGVKVVSVDYRRPPLYPFPAAINDVIAVWQAVTKDQSAAKTALFGTSAGGNIALATVLKLPLLQANFDLYAGGEVVSNPILSPVNGDLKGFPPTILISGTRDLLLSDTVRMHRALRKADVEADLHVYDGQTHADFLQNLTRYVPECEDAQRELFKFFDKHLK
jgi:acetyl esterase/lipase